MKFEARKGTKDAKAKHGRNGQPYGPHLRCAREALLATLLRSVLVLLVLGRGKTSLFIATLWIVHLGQRLCRVG